MGKISPNLDPHVIVIDEKKRRSILVQLEIRKKIRAEKENRRRHNYFK